MENLTIDILKARGYVGINTSFPFDECYADLIKIDGVTMVLYQKHYTVDAWGAGKRLETKAANPYLAIMEFTKKFGNDITITGLWKAGF